MDSTPGLIDEIRRARIERARQMHPIDKALAGADLFDAVRERMAWGVLLDDPNADEEQVQRIVRQRLAAQRERDQRP